MIGPIRRPRASRTAEHSFERSRSDAGKLFNARPTSSLNVRFELKDAQTVQLNIPSPFALLMTALMDTNIYRGYECFFFS